MDEMYHTCRWCKHYKDGKCLKEIVDVFIADDVIGDIIGDDMIEVFISDPENFYCKEWE